MKSVQAHIKQLRSDFKSDILDEKDVSKSPFKQFEKWLRDALDADVNEPNAMTLATGTKDGYADARVVLLRDFNTRGFSFFTNYNSIKGQQIRQSKKVCLNFFWPELFRQVRIRGIVEKESDHHSDLYFQSRPRESQIAAWASSQSEKLIGRDELINNFDLYQMKFRGVKIPRPPHWGGFRVNPVYLEFWQGQPNRLHDRIVYELKSSNKWIIKRLNP